MEHTREIHVSEEYDQVRHQPTPEELRAAKRNPWTARIPDFDSVPSGRLRVTMQRSYDKRDEWTGLHPKTFKTRVRQMLDDIAAGNAEEHRRREAWQREQEEIPRKWAQRKEEEGRRWEEAMTRAHRKATVAIRENTFMSAFDAWSRARELRAFCTDLRQSAADGTSAELEKWIAWGLAEADRIDPTHGPISLSDVSFDIEPGPDDLRAFLGDWSPHRPEQEYRSVSKPVPDTESYRAAWHPGLRGKKQWWRRDGHRRSCHRFGLHSRFRYSCAMRVAR
ncbi:hypothetical protein [Allorhizocola rhizosphaerae]|uniref:hypothetical protein n=1 Tax=Allorhizocola rhizosphaerae TaxID=1872709 RepID=UPI000E3CA5C8|nr:hypothetical protein [Allorhizocola rhizosphaerae]